MTIIGILLVVGIAFVGWQLYRIAKILKDSHIIQKAVLKKAIDIDNAIGTDAHRRIIKNLYAIYAAIFGVPKPVVKPTPDGYEDTIIDRKF